MKNQQQLLLHAVKAIRYRFHKATTGMNDTFGRFSIHAHTRTPVAIVHHMNDLAAKTNTMIQQGHFDVPLPTELTFTDEQQRFLRSIDGLIQVLIVQPVPLDKCKRLLQGPILDMATHIGQLAMLRGMAVHPLPRENYFEAAL